MIIAVYADSRKKSTKLIANFSKRLANKGQETDSLVISIGNSPKKSVNPYINGVYDIHSRYNHLETLVKYQDSKEILFVIGQTIDTIIEEVKNLSSEADLTNYINWITSLEQESYLLPKVDMNIVASDSVGSKKQFNIIKKHPRYKNILEVKGNEDKIIKKILSHKPYKDSYNMDISLYDCLVRRAYGHKQAITIKNVAKAQLTNKQLSTLRKNYLKINGVNSYGSFISLPLSCPVASTDYSTSLMMHQESIDSVISALTKESFYPVDNDLIKPVYANEVIFIQKIGHLYNANLNGIGINKRRRLLEIILNNLQKGSVGNLPFMSLSAKLSYYDFFLISNLVRLTAIWELPSVKYGFVDVGNNSSSTILEEIFDQASFIATASGDTNLATKLLLGHINNFYLELSFNGVVMLLQKGPQLNGSECLSSMLSKLEDEFSNRYPILFELIKN